MWNIKTNSKLVKKNDIFICTHDEYLNRHIYIDDALIKKPSAIIIDEEVDKKIKVPVIRVNDTNDTLFQIAHDYYGKPLEKIKLIGITGTDGKTTTATMVKDLLSFFTKAAYLGTNGFCYDNVSLNTTNTTPGIAEIIKYASIALENNCKYLIMEVSSEGLLHNRCQNLLFDQTILTNVTKDHLNIHKDFNNYLNSKLKLFDQLRDNGTNVINIDDNSYSLFKKRNNAKTISYGKNNDAMFRFDNIKEYLGYTTFDLIVKDDLYHIKSPFCGEFNVYNLVCALAVISNLGFSLDDVMDKIMVLKPIKGRMNFIDSRKGFKIVLDYAHTTKATLEVLTYINKVKTGKIITVVGCAGDRYKDKREEIGKIVADYSDIAIFTMDDPRNEKIENIFSDMEKNIRQNNVIKIKNRKKAIKKAINLATNNDILLILGKGTDSYMAVKNKYKKYNDLDVIKKILSL